MFRKLYRQKLVNFKKIQEQTNKQKLKKIILSKTLIFLFLIVIFLSIRLIAVYAVINPSVYGFNSIPTNSFPTGRAEPASAFGIYLIGNEGLFFGTFPGGRDQVGIWIVSVVILAPLLLLLLFTKKASHTLFVGLMFTGLFSHFVDRFIFTNRDGLPVVIDYIYINWGQYFTGMRGGVSFITNIGDLYFVAGLALYSFALLSDLTGTIGRHRLNKIKIKLK